MTHKQSQNVSKRSFPEKLLAAPASDRVAWFENRAVEHQTMTRVKNEIHRRLKGGGKRYPVILVVGPTGIGKSTLMLVVKKEIIKAALPALNEDPGRIPIASIEASAPDSGIFNWKDHYIKCLTELREVLIMHKLKDADCDLCRGKNNLSDNPRVSAHSFRHALEHALAHRKPAGFFIDEAQHLTKMSSGRRVIDQMDVIKSIANATRIPHVLFGTYDLLSLRNLNGQLSRRNTEIHFGRYRFGQPQELAEFKRVLRSFESLMPIEQSPELEKHWEFMYERSLGCVGTLKDWLTRALEFALDHSSGKFTFECLRQSAMSVSRCEKIAEEISYGEKRLDEDHKSLPRLHSLLGMKAETKARSTGDTFGAEKIHEDNEEQETASDGAAIKNPSNKRRPFEQNPKRHPTERKQSAA